MPVFSHAFLHSRRFGADLAEAMLGEMQDIRLVEHEKGKPAITVLTDRQRAVCWAFDFECPDLCPPPQRTRW